MTRQEGRRASGPHCGRHGASASQSAVLSSRVAPSGPPPAPKFIESSAKRKPQLSERSESERVSIWRSAHLTLHRPKTLTALLWSPRDRSRCRSARALLLFAFAARPAVKGATLAAGGSFCSCDKDRYPNGPRQLVGLVPHSGIEPVPKGSLC